MKNLKKIALATGAAGMLATALVAPAQAADSTPVVYATVGIGSATPVPGLATIGTAYIGNSGPVGNTPLPVGTEFTVKFVPMPGDDTTGRATFTTVHGSDINIFRVDDNTFRVVTISPLMPGAIVSMDWSKAHLFHPAARDQAEISLSKLPEGTTDGNSFNNTAVYDNDGRGS